MLNLACYKKKAEVCFVSGALFLVLWPGFGPQPCLQLHTWMQIRCVRWGTTVTALTNNGKVILDNFLYKMLIKESVENDVNMQEAHLILYSFTFLFILGILLTFWQELLISPTIRQCTPLTRRLFWILYTMFRWKCLEKWV